MQIFMTFSHGKSFAKNFIEDFNENDLLLLHTLRRAVTLTFDPLTLNVEVHRVQC